MTTTNNNKTKRGGWLAGLSFTLCLLSFSVAFTSCQNGDWDEPDLSQAPYGNNAITDAGVITIAELIARYPNVFASTDQNAEITEDIKIRGRVTGNDIGSNLYKQFALQDATAAIIIAVNQNGLSGFLAEGQEIIVDLKGLHIGGYRKQPEIGAPYNGTSIGRMQKDIWQKHFKIVGTPDANAIKPIDFDAKMDMESNCGKLVTLRGVTFSDANGKNVFAPENDPSLIVGGCVNRSLQGYGSNVVVRTSTYAKFAAMKLPYDEKNKVKVKCDITGIATRYNNTWQILIRKSDDIHPL